MPKRAEGKSRCPRQSCEHADLRHAFTASLLRLKALSLLAKLCKNANNLEASNGGPLRLKKHSGADALCMGRWPPRLLSLKSGPVEAPTGLPHSLLLHHHPHSSSCAFRASPPISLLLPHYTSSTTMFTRRVTRSSTRANNGNTNNVPAAPPVANNATQMGAAEVAPTMRMRSGRLLSDIASVVVGRRRRNNASQAVATAEASTSNAVAHPVVVPAPVPAPPRKRARKDAQPAASSSNVAASNAPAPAPTTAAPRKRAVTKKQASTTRTRSVKGKSKAVAPPSPSPPAPSMSPRPVPIPEDEQLQPVPWSAEDIEEITRAIETIINTSLSADPVHTPQYASLIGTQGYEHLGPVFNFLQPAWHHVMFKLSNAEEQPRASTPRVEDVIPGYDTQTADAACGEIEDINDPESSQVGAAEGAKEGAHAEPDLNHNPIVFPSAPADSAQEEAGRRLASSVPGAHPISRQNACIFDSNGRPLPVGRWQGGIPDPIGDKVAELLKAASSPPYPANWHGSAFDPEPTRPVRQLPTSSSRMPPRLRRQNAFCLAPPEEETRAASGSNSQSQTAHGQNAAAAEEPTTPMEEPTTPTEEPATPVSHSEPEPGPPASTTRPMPPRIRRQNAFRWPSPPEKEPRAASGSNTTQATTTGAAAEVKGVEDRQMRPLPRSPKGVLPAVHEVQPSAAVIERLKQYGVQPLRRQSHFFLEKQARMREAGLLPADDVEEVAPPVPSSSSTPAPAHTTPAPTSGATASPTLSVKQRLRAQGLHRAGPPPLAPEVLEEFARTGVYDASAVYSTPLRRGMKMQPPPEPKFNLPASAPSDISALMAQATSPARPSLQQAPSPAAASTSDASPVRRGAPLRRGQGIPPPPEFLKHFSRHEPSTSAVEATGAQPSTAAEAGPATSTAAASSTPAPEHKGPSKVVLPPGCAPLRRHDAVYLDKNFRERPRWRESPTPFDPTEPQISTAEATPSTAPTDAGGDPRAARIRALSRTPSQSSLGTLSVARSGRGVAFSRSGSQPSIGAASTTTTPETPAQDKGKGKGSAAAPLPAIPEGAREEPDVGSIDEGKGKKRARSPEDEDDEMAEVEASLIFDSDDEAAIKDGSGDADECVASGWPVEYRLKQGPWTVDVAKVKLPFLPVAPLPKRRKVSEAVPSEEAAVAPASALNAPAVRPGKRVRTQSECANVPEDVASQPAKKRRVENS
ncbi:hypothetical protein C8Q80DRAFT_180492 [Daedaleopsis nitida]|nr:hypothetical protein C8Q80DRAFT_180492 [Daedaleopsis nitida]